MSGICDMRMISQTGRTSRLPCREFIRMTRRNSNCQWAVRNGNFIMALPKLTYLPAMDAWAHHRTLGGRGRQRILVDSQSGTWSFPYGRDMKAIRTAFSRMSPKVHSWNWVSESFKMRLIGRPWVCTANEPYESSGDAFPWCEPGCDLSGTRPTQGRNGTVMPLHSLAHLVQTLRVSLLLRNEHARWSRYLSSARKVMPSRTIIVREMANRRLLKSHENRLRFPLVHERAKS
jgi:hypothetical protein